MRIGEPHRRLPKGIQLVDMSSRTVYSTDGTTRTVSASYLNHDPAFVARVRGIQPDSAQQANVDRARAMLRNKRAPLTAEEKAKLETLEGRCGDCPELAVATRGESRTKPRVTIACPRRGNVFQAISLLTAPECPPFE
jgi:hypothetical protein